MFITCHPSNIQKRRDFTHFGPDAINRSHCRSPPESGVIFFWSFLFRFASVNKGLGRTRKWSLRFRKTWTSSSIHISIGENLAEQCMSLDLITATSEVGFPSGVQNHDPMDVTDSHRDHYTSSRRVGVGSFRPRIHPTLVVRMAI